MDQGVIANFKSYYLREVMRHIVEGIENSGEDALNVWKKYHIGNALQNIDVSWSKVSKTAMAGVWKQLWPEICPDTCTEVNIEMVKCKEKIIEQNSKAGLESIELADIDGYLDSYFDELTNEELIEIDHETIAETFSNDKKVQVKKILNLSECLKSYVDDYEDGGLYSSTVSTVLDGLMLKYEKELENL